MILLIPALLLVTAVGAGLIGGVFFAFSSFVMPALKRLPAAEGTRAMQMINVTVLNWHFLGTFFGTALFGLACAAIAIWQWDHPGAGLALYGGLTYVLGTFAVTAACNVPRNEALARTEAGTPEADALWQRYLVEWTYWNHVRTAAAIAACAELIVSVGQWEC